MEQGIIIFLKTNIGSKSESLQPFLYQNGGKIIRLSKQGDNPFENESLKPFDGEKVKVTAENITDEIMYIDSIEKI